MGKLRKDDGPERLKQLWLAYEYPGRMVLRDVARLGKWFRRTWTTLTGNAAVPSSKQDAEDHLWAERRD